MTASNEYVRDYEHATRRLHEELAEEARNYLALLARRDAGEDVDSELYVSTFHLGTHATLLSERMDEDPALDLPNAADDQRAS